jgi:hypothetical protein
MTPTNVIIKSLISSRPPETPPDSSAYMPENNSHAHVSSQVDSIDRFEYAVKKLIRALEKLNARNKTKDIKIKITKHVEAKKLKIRVSKLKYKLIDEVYVD